MLLLVNARPHLLLRFQLLCASLLERQSSISQLRQLSLLPSCASQRQLRLALRAPRLQVQHVTLLARGACGQILGVQHVRIQSRDRKGSRRA